MNNSNKSGRGLPAYTGAVFILFITLFAAAGVVNAETIRLKDGQIINGEILKKTEYSVIVKTPYQTRRIAMNEIVSIDREENKQERLFILTRDREIISGYLVEQDSLQVQYKTGPDDKIEKTISKLDILQMSSDEIRPVDLALGFRTGIFCPFHTGGSDLGVSPLFMADIGISSMMMRYLRFFMEVGYACPKNSDNNGRRMQIIPVTMNCEYRFMAPWKIEISPRFGLGAAMADYNSGEKDEKGGTLFLTTTGVRFTYPVKKHRIYAGLFTDYNLMTDTSGMISAISCGACIEYRL